MTMTLASTSTIVGIIVGIAILASTIAVCLYLYSLKNKSVNEEDIDAPKEEEKSR